MLSREEILAKKVGEKVVDLPSGGQVRVRGLSRDEALRVQEADGGTAGKDNMTISQGLVEPALTLAEVEQWATTAPAADSIEISRAIAQLSGMTEGAGKSGVPAARE